jgi:hypothetical protein
MQDEDNAPTSTLPLILYKLRVAGDNEQKITEGGGRDSVLVIVEMTPPYVRCSIASGLKGIRGEHFQVPPGYMITESLMLDINNGYRCPLVVHSK